MSAKHRAWSEPSYTCSHSKRSVRRTTSSFTALRSTSPALGALTCAKHNDSSPAGAADDAIPAGSERQSALVRGGLKAWAPHQARNGS